MNESRLLKTVSLAVFVLLAACGGVRQQQLPAVVVQADRQLDLLGELESISSVAPLKQVLSVYESYDDLGRQWRANFTIANWFVANNNKEEALDYAVRAEVLSRRLASKQRYASLIQLGQLNGDPAIFQTALSVASSSEERALSLTMLGRVHEVEPMLGGLDGQKNPYPVAFIYYRYAAAKSDLPMAEKAVELYRRSGNHYGVVDGLFLCALLSGESDVAVDYAERALRSAIHLPGERRARSIANWLQEKEGKPLKP